MTEPVKLDRWDVAVCVGLAGSYLALLLATVHDLGYARDEGFYFQAARSYEAWFELLRTDFAAALEPAVIDRYWSANHEHPALMKSLFALTPLSVHGLAAVSRTRHGLSFSRDGGQHVGRGGDLRLGRA